MRRTHKCLKWCKIEIREAIIGIEDDIIEVKLKY